MKGWSCMGTRRPKIISRKITIEVAQRNLSTSSIIPNWIPKGKTYLDKVYEEIDGACCDCWDFTDTNGTPWITKEGLTLKEGNVIEVRFRCPIYVLHAIGGFDRVVNRVCKKYNSKICYCFKEQEGYLTSQIIQRYLEGVWLILEGSGGN